MKIFVTGASGFIGSHVVPELLANGHQVLGLARSDASAAAIEVAGGEVIRGELSDLDSLRKGAQESDGVIHLAFIHDFSPTGDMNKAVDADRAAIDAMGEVLAGTNKPLVIASGTPVVPGAVATENDWPPADGPLSGRADTARAVVDMASTGVRTSVVRLPRTVHGAGGEGGFAGILIQVARQAGVSGYVGDGSARWPAVDVDDTARLFRLAVEKAPAGAVLHAIADEGVSLLDTATAIGSGLGVPVQSVPAEKLGFLGMLATVDQPASGKITQEQFDWTPTGPSLLDNLGKGNFV